jgi:hypothetical protein
MMTSESDSLLSQLHPAEHLYGFLNKQPSPFREQLLYRLYTFFEKEIFSLSADSQPDNAFAKILYRSIAYMNLQRGILIIGALDYLFSQKAPWTSEVEDHLLMKAAGMTLGAFHPVREEPYVQARQEWKKFRSLFSYSLLRKIDQKLAKEWQLGDPS